MIGSVHGSGGCGTKEEKRMELPGKQEMERAQELYQRQQAEEKKPSNDYSNKVAQRLWQRMLELYGRQWEASYGHVDGDVFPAWRDALAGLSADKIKRGLEAVINEGNEFPPNLIKFLRLCKTAPYSTMSESRAALPPPNVHRKPEVITAKEKHFAEVRKLSG